MDKHFVVAKSLATLQPKIAGLVGSLQNNKGFAARDMTVAGAIDDTGLKVQLSKVANQGLLELNGANYLVKGHAKTGQSKARSQSKGKKAGKKASTSKGRKKSAGPKKSKSAGPKKSKLAGPKKSKSAGPKRSKSAGRKKGEAASSIYK